ncbi:tumor necrosis factor receptor superfamily member 5 isoform X2 [Etheostoma spectabile]|uniref:tumor necrosis factor receptor superfamily member 5 isoform X2 n=1 Tax=Etheostoma spectabile TaxID=54343 RepID=UPI0013AEEFAE|nr:tumor necrosis factor receptor superfamily member 5-like isoform X2 [Etheostoma spectabile]
MHALLLLLLLLGFVAMTTAQPQCDPLTEHELDGQCCKMCGPGTRMSSSSPPSSCQDPQCVDCGDNEYQEKYTKETKCQRQPYCDPHKNFQTAVHKSKKKQSPCVCKEGFHCSSKECITCVPHTPCKPGYGVQNIATHMEDTVCQKCPEGTFSNDSSWHSVCMEWTECESGYRIRQSGTDVSDNICEETSRRHIVLIVVLALGIGALAILGIVYWLCKGKQEDAHGKVCVGSCFGDGRQPLRETKVLITNPTDATDEESMKLPELQSSQEEGGAGTPEENEDQQSQEISAGLFLTENGKLVTEEHGKSSHLSRQESQPHTITDSYASTAFTPTT